MPVVYLTQRGLKATVTGERIEITPPPEPEGPLPERRWIPLMDVEHVVLDNAASLGNRSITALLSRNIPVLFIANGRFPGGWATPFTRQSLILAAQLDACRDERFRLDLGKRVIDAKIRNMRRVLQRLSANRYAAQQAGSWLSAMANQVRAAGSLDALRGLEGAASGRYFETLGRFFPKDVPFERRTRRPPKNAANALLSFIYTLLIGEFVLNLRACGLESGWGCFHEPEDGRPALALDLVEPFRAAFADALALDLLNHRRLKPDDFDENEGAYLLKRDRRRTVFSAYEDRMEREFNYRISGERTTLRAILKQHCFAVKRAFREGLDDFQPFILN